MKILGIESSCDETGAALVEDGIHILSNVVASSESFHAKTGGIIPEVAAREQIKCMIPVINEAVTESFDAIAVTVGPGLLGSLLIGIETAKTLSYVYKKPIVPVNHLIGHLYANWLYKPSSGNKPTKLTGLFGELRRYSPAHVYHHTLTGECLESRSKIPSDFGSPYCRTRAREPVFPAVAFVISGGHTDLVLLRNHKTMEYLGGTRDDAAGECFDKTARLLGFSYPGGPAISREALHGDPHAYDFPRPMLHSQDFDFSFSGLKTAVLTTVKRLSKDELELRRADLCASIEAAIVDVLVVKATRAARVSGVNSIILGGGVAANKRLRKAFENSGFTIYAPTPSLCSDNGAMIGSAAYFQFRPIDWHDIVPDPSLSLEQ